MPTNLEKLKAIDKAYYMLIPCVKNNTIQDYGLVLTEAPNYLAELISEAETNPAASSEPANPAKETVVGYDEDGMPLGIPRIKLVLTVIASPDDEAFLEKAQGLISEVDSTLMPDAVSHRHRIVITKIERFPAHALSNVSCRRMDCVHHDKAALSLRCEEVRLVINEGASCASYRKREAVIIP